MESHRSNIRRAPDVAIADPQYDPFNRRPGTTINSTTNDLPHDNPSKGSKANQWGQTQSSFKPKLIHEQVLEKEIPEFSFSPFRTPQKALPKLYTTHQHETMSHKYNDLKQRYQKLYKKADVAEEDMIEGTENLKDIYLETEKLMNGTYSVKYFGVQGDELGITSKRLPMSQSTSHTPCLSPKEKKQNSHRKNVSVHESKKSLEQKKDAAQSKKSEPSTQQTLKSPLDGRKHGYNLSVNIHKVSDLLGGDRMQSIENEMKAVEGDDMDKYPSKTGKIGSYQSEKMPTLSTKGQFKPYYHTPRGDSMNYIEKGVGTDQYRTEEGKIGTNQGEILSTRGMVNPGMSQNASKTQFGFSKINAQNDPYIVTKYLLPKKLQAVKKQPRENIAISQTHRLWGTKIETPEPTPTKKFHSNASTHRAVIQEQAEEQGTETNLPFDNRPKAPKKGDLDARRLTSMEKVKRNLLRSVNVEKVWETRANKDELDIPEQFRTYEVNKVMADRAKYSYAKLLETMNTNERPETALVESTEKMQRILSVRENKRKAIDSKNSTKSDGFGRVGSLDSNGNYVVKVSYPKENEMFNRFWKIKHTVNANEQEE